MAEFGGLCQPHSLLSFWDSSRCSFGLLVENERRGTLDRDTSWCFRANRFTLSHNKLSELEETGLFPQS